MPEIERLSLYLSPEAKARIVAEVARRREQGESYWQANQTTIVEALILAHLPMTGREEQG